MLGPNGAGRPRCCAPSPACSRSTEGTCSSIGEILDDPAAAVRPRRAPAVGVVFQSTCCSAISPRSRTWRSDCGPRSGEGGGPSPRADLARAIRARGLRPGAARRPVRRSGAACRVGSGARHRPACCCSTSRSPRSMSGPVGKCAATCASISPRSTACDCSSARSGRRVRAGRSRGHPRRRADRPGRHDRRGDRPPAIEIRRRTGRAPTSSPERWPMASSRVTAGPRWWSPTPIRAVASRSSARRRSRSPARPGRDERAQHVARGGGRHRSLGDRVRVSIVGPSVSPPRSPPSRSTRWRCALVIRCMPRSRPPTSTPTRPDRFDPCSDERTDRGVDRWLIVEVRERRPRGDR